jgi:hypothetical protein
VKLILSPEPTATPKPKKEETEAKESLVKKVLPSFLWKIGLG